MSHETIQIQHLERKVKLLEQALIGFKPMIVNLRIDGVVRPVVLFAKDLTPDNPFTVVK